MPCAWVKGRSTSPPAPPIHGLSTVRRFNSYTQQICIDDAVIIDPQRAENVLTNDGSTMRIMVQSMGKPSAWSRQKEIVVDDRAQILEAEEGSAELIESNNKEAQKSSPSEELADPEREAQGKLCSKKTISRSEDGLGPANVHSDTADKKGPQVPERTQEDKQLEIQDPEQDPDTPTTLEDEAENNHSDTMADPDIIGDGNVSSRPRGCLRNNNDAACRREILRFLLNACEAPIRCGDNCKTPCW